MYKSEYIRWLNADIDDEEIKDELRSIGGDDKAIKERFGASLTFGTAGLRGILGAGTNRMNVCVVRQATQGLAGWIKAHGKSNSAVISFDSRLRSDTFAREAARVLAANGISVRIFPELNPVPALSFAVRFYGADAGVMITASHNPSQYNGYKAYGPDGCQMREDAADSVYENILKTDVLTGAALMPYEKAERAGLIKYVENDCMEAFFAGAEKCAVRPLVCADSSLKVVYSPLNGTGLKPVTRILADMGVKDVFTVKEQENPDGHFPTCPYPNPEKPEALELGIRLAKETGADLVLATDPDADRVGVAVRDKNGSYRLITGNEMGVLLLDYICAGRIERGDMPKDPVAVTSIVSTPLADVVAERYDVRLKRVLTGFKWIGEQIALLEQKGETDRFIFGFEESYGYTASSYVRDKDAVAISGLICEMAAYYRKKGSSIEGRLTEIYDSCGYYEDKVISFDFPGIDGAKKMASVMEKLRGGGADFIGGYKVLKVTDYEKPDDTNLPKSNVLSYEIEGDLRLIVRPSGTEPKVKAYFSAAGKDSKTAKEKVAAMERDVRAVFTD